MKINKNFIAFIIVILLFVGYLVFLQEKVDEPQKKKKKTFVERKHIDDIIDTVSVFDKDIPLTSIRVVPQLKKGISPKNVKIKYFWTVNGISLPNTAYLLEKSEFKKGESIICTIEVEYRKKPMKGKKEIKLKGPNSPPVITQTPINSFDVNDSFAYQIEALDPDGDELTYKLLKPLNVGIELDEKSGYLKWKLSGNENDQAKIPEALTKPGQITESSTASEGTVLVSNVVEIVFTVIDKDGASARGSIEIDLDTGKEIPK